MWKRWLIILTILSFAVPLWSQDGRLLQRLSNGRTALKLESSVMSNAVGFWMDTTGTAIKTGMWVNYGTSFEPATNDSSASHHVGGITSTTYKGDSVFVIAEGYVDTTGLSMGSLSPGKLFIGSNSYSRNTVESTANGKVFQQVGIIIGKKFIVRIYEAEIYTSN